MDVAATLQQAREDHAAGHYEQARAGYEKILTARPDNPEVCYLLALLHIGEGETGQARHWFAETVRLAPQAAPAHYNLGVIAAEQGEWAAAIGHYRDGLAVQPDDMDTLFNLALALKETGRLPEAEECYLAILARHEDVESRYNLAMLYKEMDRFDEAIASLEQVLRQDNDHLPALNNLAYLYHRQQRLAEAAEIYKRLIASDYNSSAARHMLAAISGEDSAAAPVDYVRDVFDQFSGHYDGHLIDKLEYHVPALLRKLLESCQPAARFGRCLDMGCGTGLSGHAFAGLCDQLTGIDLSPRMLALAADKGIYHQLHEGDIVSCLRKQDEPFDLFLAADVFVYVGDLRPIFAQVSRLARAGSLFLFSCEGYDGEGFCLKESGRYGHAPDYIARLAREFAWQMTAVESAHIRKERGEWIGGNVFLLTNQHGWTRLASHNKQ